MIPHVRQAVCAALLIMLPALAFGGPFSTAISVNGSVISNYDIEQRMRMLRVLGIDGNLRGKAEDALVNDRLYLQEAERLGIVAGPLLVEDGLAEYASRLQMTSEQFFGHLGAAGVNRDTVVEFIRAGVTWREVVSARFGRVAREVTDDEIDQALALRGTAQSEQVLLSEIVMQFRPATRDRIVGIADTIVRTVRSSGGFAEAARSLSDAPSAQQGGAIGWVAFDNIDNNTRGRLQRAANGTAVGPFISGSSVTVLFKRDTRQVEIQQRGWFADDYATLRVYGSGSQSARAVAEAIRARLDTCNDLLAESRRFPKGSHFRMTSAPEETVENLREPLGRLDAGETTIIGSASASADTVVILMLCDRKSGIDPESRQAVLGSLRNEKAEDLSQKLLSNLRAAAIIKRY